MSDKEKPIDKLKATIHRGIINLEGQELDFEKCKGLFKTMLTVQLIIVEEWLEQDKWNKKTIKEIEELKKHG